MPFRTQPAALLVPAAIGRLHHSARRVNRSAAQRRRLSYLTAPALAIRIHSVNLAWLARPATAQRRVPPAWFDPAAPPTEPIPLAESGTPIDITAVRRSTEKLASLQTPPPLSNSPNSSVLDRESTVDPTPVTTPVFAHPEPARFKEKGLHFSLQSTPSGHAHPLDPLELDGDILFDDAADCTLLPASPPPLGIGQQPLSLHQASNRAAQMAAIDGPVDIATSRQNSTSPRNQTSTLSAALQGAAAQPIATPTSAPRSGNDGRLSIGARQDSISHIGSYYGTGARPISVKDRPRRESTTAGSLLNGMSWGGVSVGSWIRDEYVPKKLPHPRPPTISASFQISGAARLGALSPVLPPRRLRHMRLLGRFPGIPFPTRLQQLARLTRTQ